MPPKKKQAMAPIDKPLSRAYLREFTGWSTAFPPGLSEATSLRTMENTLINRDGSLKVRPGLRYLSYTTLPDVENDVVGTGLEQPSVGSHEAFFLNDGTKAYLFAVREDDLTVGFRVLVLSTVGSNVQTLTAAGFAIPQTEAVLNFSVETTYVKYLQIDNKVFALSNAGEPMRMFNVGEIKSARKLTALETPQWEVADKLTVVKPDEPWINAGIPTGTRYNLAKNPSFETGAPGVVDGTLTDSARSSTLPKIGSYGLRIKSRSTRTNLMPSPMRNPATGVGTWVASTFTGSVSEVSGSLRIICAADNPTSTDFLARPAAIPVVANEVYRIAFDLVGRTGLTDLNLQIRFRNAAGATISTHNRASSTSVGRKNPSGITAPAGAVDCLVYWVGSIAAGGTGQYTIDDIVFVKDGEATTVFDGSSGAGYQWVGTPNASSSIYHPPTDTVVTLPLGDIEPGKTYTAFLNVRALTTAAPVKVGLYYYDSGGAQVGFVDSAYSNDSAAAWQQRALTLLAGTFAVTAKMKIWIDDLPYNDQHFIDEMMLEEAGSAGTYFSGATTSTSTVKHTWTGTAHASTSKEVTYAVATVVPPAETATANTLISSTSANNQYNFGYFYTFTNEVGESAPSQITLVRAQRRQSAWKWEAADASGNPNGVEITDPTLAADQLVAYMPSDVYALAKAQGALTWNLYVLTWSDQDPVPPEGLLVESKPLTSAGTHGTEGWIRHTPQNIDASASSPLPSATNRFNYSEPSSAAQGLIGADRMVLVLDPNQLARIKWSSNQQGEYTNFTASKGGGYKTLTSGNLFVPACVKLWQNPQSVDTLTILCMGVDGYSTSYYMQPAQITSQTDSTNLMGFEETTATPGTCAPYGVEVLNNALYHPVETELTKSTAANYNINHKPMTDLIQNRWSDLLDKDKIVSSQLDNRLYYLVHNPHGAGLEVGCWGNEVWIFDAAAENGTWSRWTVQGQSLRKIELDGRLAMSIVRPDGLYAFDDRMYWDEYVDPDTGEVHEQPIYWEIETNTQGSNRTHDAWCHLQQVNLNVGNFFGALRYGIRGLDIHGKWVDRSKLIRDIGPDGQQFSPDMLPYDREDFLAIDRQMKEWRFYARSEVVGLDDPPGEVLFSAGQLNLIQYRYTPVSVNVGYDLGSVETFEYGRNALSGANVQTTDGVPVMYIDRARP